MEYLTLQDIPHRHFAYAPRSMAPPERPWGSGRQLPGLAAKLRHSPPLQPGEPRMPPSLPSFSQLLGNLQELSPPRSPVHKDTPAQVSSVAHGLPLKDVSWVDGKRRRLDSAPDIHPSSVAPEHSQPGVDARRGSAIDPPLPGAHAAHYQQPPTHHHHHHHHHHRGSLPYASPLPAALPTASHARHQSAPSSRTQAPYPHAHPPPASSVVPPAPYPPPPNHIRAYDRRPSYHVGPHPAALNHSYDRPYDAYYPPPAYGPPPPSDYGAGAGYHHHQAQPPYSYTFHSSLGVDQNSFSRKRRGNLPKEATALLKAWFAQHRESPYPSEDEKVELCRQTQLTLNQVSNWFINARRRAPQKEQREARDTVEEA